MKKLIVPGIVLLVMIVAGLTAAVYGQKSQMVPERLDNSVFPSPRRPPAVFSHDDHIDLADDNCSICHHVYENGVLQEGESSEDSYCSDCHHLKPAQDNPIGLEVAYHRMCRDCHFESNTGPVLCGQCHITE